MPKRKLSDELSRRFTTEAKIEVEDPLKAAAASLGKDADLQESEQDDILESKNVRMHARTKESEQESTSEEKPENVPVSTPERKQTRKQASSTTRKQERVEVSEEAYIGKGVIIEVLYDQIQQKKHLSNGSFRYKADELEKLDTIFKDLEAQKPGRISKNDIARMALIAFYEDYEKNGEESILAQVFKRM